MCERKIICFNWNLAKKRVSTNVHCRDFYGPDDSLGAVLDRISAKKKITQW